MPPGATGDGAPPSAPTAHGHARLGTAASGVPVVDVHYTVELVFKYAFWLFVGAISFSIAGMLILKLVPSSIAYFGPYYDKLIKTPTWTYMSMLPILALMMYGPALGWRRMVLYAAWGCVIGGASELIGTTGWATVGGFEMPFGGYDYHPNLLGAKIAGHVPYFIPPSWFAMAIVSFDLARRATGSAVGRVLLGTLFMVLWDVSLDPAMNNAYPFWTYDLGTGFWTGDFFYGMPLSNWAGWLVVSLVIVAGFEAFGGLPVASAWAPWVYFLNCFFPLMISLVEGLEGAFVWGALATAVPYVCLVLARRHSADPAVQAGASAAFASPLRAWRRS
jgi:putative membrane protein